MPFLEKVAFALRGIQVIFYVKMGSKFIYFGLIVTSSMQCFDGWRKRMIVNLFIGLGK